MAFKLKNTEYDIEMIAGDDEYIRLNVKDEDGVVVDVSSNVTCVLGIKRNEMDDTFLIPEINATTYVYDAVTQPFTIQFIVDSDATVALLNYNGKARQKLECVYDIELHDTHLGANARTTILAGKLTITRSISGKVL